MYGEGEELEKIRRTSQRRLSRTTERARQQDTRCAILAMLAEGGEAMTEAQISGRLPGKRRGNLLHARYHLDVLCESRLVNRDTSDPPLYSLV